jgi:lipopolysaccharide cholinephosphotransferase
MRTLSEEEHKKLKEKELDILKAFLEVCEKLGLTYFVTGGTLLGAVRHQGFIPWDDDIDVILLRRDYDVFISKAQEYLPDRLFLQNIHTEKEWFSNYSKIRDNDTTYIESEAGHLSINHGVYIDVFPLDNYPDSFFGRMMLETKLRMLDRRLYDVYRGDGTGVSGKARLVQMITRTVWPDLKRVSYIKERLISSVPDSSYVRVYCGAWGKREIVKKEWYDEAVQLPFEDITVNAAKGYKEYLSHMYGDYMTLPPEEERKGHHPVEAFDPQHGQGGLKKDTDR